MKENSYPVNLTGISVQTEERFDWMKKNNFVEWVFLFKTKYLLRLNNICLKETKYLWGKWIFFESNEFFFKTKKLMQ